MRYEINFNKESSQFVILKTRRKLNTFKKSRIAKKYLTQLRKDIEVLELLNLFKE